MKRLLRLGLAICLVSVVWEFAIAQDQAATDDPRQALAIIESFLNAHIDGRPDIIKQFLGGELLDKRTPLLNNPAYADLLKATYEGVRYEMVDWKYLNKNSIQIDVGFDSIDQQSKRIRYVLTRNTPVSDDKAPSFLVISQTEITR